MISDFEELIDLLRIQLSQPLPGLQAQRIMAPVGRPDINRAMTEYQGDIKKSGVLLTLLKLESEITFTLMKRNSYDGHHSDQISIPGGRFEPEDQNLEATALREFEEEMGIPRNKLNSIGRLSPVFIPPSGYYVEPYIAFSERAPNFKIDPKEVEEVLSIPIRDLLNENLKTTAHVQTSPKGFEMKAPAYILGGHIVWGATAMILAEFEWICKRLISQA